MPGHSIPARGADKQVLLDQRKLLLVRDAAQRVQLQHLIVDVRVEAVTARDGTNQAEHTDRITAKCRTRQSTAVLFRRWYTVGQ